MRNRGEARAPAGASVPSIAAVQRVHVATRSEERTRELAAPSVKRRLAALRHLFDWLVTGHVMLTNPAGSVRGPQHIVKGGKTPVLESGSICSSRLNHTRAFLD